VAIDGSILDATVDELIECGFIGLSMEAIAARAGVAKTTLYRRWPGTYDLAVEATRGLEAGLAEDAPAGSARDSLFVLLDRMRRTWANPRFGALMRRMAADGTRQPEIYRDCRDRLVAQHLRLMRRELERAVAEGLIGADVELTWVRQMLCAPIMSAVLTHGTPLTRGQLEFVLDTVLRGLAP
jgi:AcrR family transcriptional regulator